MRLEEIDGTVHVWLRQSWLDTALKCMERARFSITVPELNITNDSAAIGTATHAAIEAALLGHQPLTAMHDEWDRLFAEPMKRTLNKTDVEMIDESARLFNVWDEHVRPHIKGDIVGVEHPFDVVWYGSQIGDTQYVVHLTGTIDLVTTEHLWDWKTSARAYNEREKQATAIQPTVYATAVRELGLLEWPIAFNFGVLIREKHTHQIVRCVRTANHPSWLARIADPLVKHGIVFGTEMPWTPNDTHNLCSEKWCSFWHLCKGHALTESDLTIIKENQ